MLIHNSCQHASGGKAKRKKGDESEDSSEEEQPAKKKAKRKSKVQLIPCVEYMLRLK
jgi:hypothetical protein